MYNKAVTLVLVMLLASFTPIFSVASAEDIDEIEILETVVNPTNNHTYHLLSASSWSDAASVARSLDGFLVTVNDADEDQWLFDTFAIGDSVTRHLWIGLSDHEDEGNYRWHDGTPFVYRNWGDGQPGDGDDEDYVHITGTNMGSIDPATWNDLEDDPQYFPVYGVVEVGQGADYALRFDGYDDYIMVDEEIPSFEYDITIEASVNVPEIDNINFITMLGDYGWGLYLNNGYVAYSNEYSMSRNPISNVSLETNTWTDVKVVVNTTVGGEFFINNESAGTFGSDKSQIPAGDFGSNDCYQSGDDCDELYIGRMGAGCDCNYFEGMIDNLRIYNNIHDSLWTFAEGEDDFTVDNNERYGDIYGAAWVMPDGTIIAQAIELFNDEYVDDIDASAGDTLLFFAEIPDNTQYLSLNAYDWYYEDEEEIDYDEIEYEIYIALDRIPSAWDHDYEVEPSPYGFYVYEYFEFPQAGTYWLTIKANYDFNELEVGAYWELAPEPPELDEMTELNDGIAVTGQSIPRNSGDELYFYVDLESELAELRVSTYGGQGNCELHIAYENLPYVGDFGWFEDEFDWKEGGENSFGNQLVSDSSYSPGNDETVQLFDAQPGIYYVMMTSWSGCRQVTIQADFTYSPQNVEPEEAVELTDGIPYGPLSGFNGLDQYFFIDVPVGTERLEIDLNNGDGEAKLMLRLEEYPTWTTYDQHSTTPGAGDKIGFNDPTPGKWYILLGSEEFYSRIDITASFEDRYVWSYDGEPIELFNKEEISGMSAPEGEELYFFIDLGEEIATDITITTWGGDGDLTLFAEVDEFEFEEFDGRTGGRQFSDNLFEVDDGEAEEQIDIFFATGIIDVTIYANSDIEEISIIAKWESMRIPGENPGIQPDPVDEDYFSCTDYIDWLFEEYDADKSGDISMEEIKIDPEEELVEFDSNRDNLVDRGELTEEFCSCDNELEFGLNQVESENGEYTIEYLMSVEWKNQFDFTDGDLNNDLIIDEDEIDKIIDECITTYNPYDRDGDGTPDSEDAFPDDPKEDTDTDGDGVGDNSDIVASLDNDVIWISASVIVLILMTVLGLMFVRSRREPEYAWQQNQRDEMSEAMLAKMQPPINSLDQDTIPPALDLGPVSDVPDDMRVSDLYD